MGTILLFLLYFIIAFLAGFGLLTLLFLFFYIDNKEDNNIPDTNNEKSINI